MMLLPRKTYRYIPYIIFFIALLSSLISLYFSEILHKVPCVLCWYQRIYMFPLVIMSAVAISRKHHYELPFYILPFSILGLITALYHNLLFYNVLPEHISPCQNSAPCTAADQIIYGWITIPLGSLISFSLITFITLLYMSIHKSFSVNKSTKEQHISPASH